jgi:hypothetical protein
VSWKVRTMAGSFSGPVKQSIYLATFAEDAFDNCVRS